MIQFAHFLPQIKKNKIIVYLHNINVYTKYLSTANFIKAVVKENDSLAHGR